MLPSDVRFFRVSRRIRNTVHPEFLSQTDQPAPISSRFPHFINIYLTVRLNLDAKTKNWYTQGMKEALSIETERTDDIPLLLTHMQRMQVAALLDKHFPTHGLRKGLSMGLLCK